MYEIVFEEQKANVNSVRRIVD